MTSATKPEELSNMIDPVWTMMMPQCFYKPYNAYWIMVSTIPPYITEMDNVTKMGLAAY